jgi:hypothetical protein
MIVAGIAFFVYFRASSRATAPAGPDAGGRRR